MMASNTAIHHDYKMTNRYKGTLGTDADGEKNERTIVTNHIINMYPKF